MSHMETPQSVEQGDPPIVQLRPVDRSDLPTLFEFQNDTVANQMAMTHARSAQDFDAHWNSILSDPGTTARAVVADGRFAGCIASFQCDGLESIGYWIGREFWGRGIATNALRLLLQQVSVRPLHSRVAVTNFGSIRVLEKCGFVVQRREWSPATERYIACEEAVLELKA